MSIYSIDGVALSQAYSVEGGLINSAFNIDGAQIFPDADPYLPGRTLVFEDDFSGNSLDTTKWEVCEGFFKQSGQEPFGYSADNVEISNSCLVLTAKRENYYGKDWSSGAIIGQRYQSFTYGRFDAKIKNSAVVGAFPAFWMMGTVMQRTFEEGEISHITSGTWPECGEIDIYEYMPGSYPNMTTISANLWKSDNGQSFGNKSLSPIDVSDWHIYSVEWTDNYISALVDNAEYGRWTFANYTSANCAAYHLPFYTMLNLAVGGSGGTPSSTDEMKMCVDWVRVYAPLS